MNRALYKSSFRSDHLPAWVCPSCERATLEVPKGGIRSFETNASRRDSEHPDWEPEWTRYVYRGHFQCPSCREFIMSAGKGVVDWFEAEDRYGNPVQVHFDSFSPEVFIPHLRLFEIPDDTPKSIVEHLHQSFSLFFCSPESAANQVRVALENTLTALKVKRFRIVGKRRKFIALHNRIDLLPAKYESVRELFFAIKWLGNAGSHGGSAIFKDDVLDAYEMMELLLLEIYGTKGASVRKLAKKINRKRGPQKK